jgi:hypothetical protein
MFPVDVTISAVYRLAGSMHMGGSVSKARRFGLEPSGAGSSVVAMVILLSLWVTLWIPSFRGRFVLQGRWPIRTRR